MKRELLAIMRERSTMVSLTEKKRSSTRCLAREMDSTLARKFIGMYVNEYRATTVKSVALAIREFLNAGRRGGFLQKNIELDFVE